jgi:hypothetical protein
LDWGPRRHLGDSRTVRAPPLEGAPPASTLHFAAFGLGLLGEVLDVIGHADGAGEELTHPRLAGGFVYHRQGVMLVVGDLYL